jgi:hypothetical protein
VKPELELPEQARERLDREQLTDVERSRLWARIDERAAVGAPRGAFVAWAALAVVAVAGIVAIMTVVFTRGDEIAKKATDSSGCTLDGTATLLSLDPTCASRSVQVNGDEWALAPGSAVTKVPEGASVERGVVTFHVRHRTSTPFLVKVSHGVVRVVGTVFRIEQSAASGSVSVTEGVIEFVWDDGTREHVAAGQTLHFPRRAAAAAEVVAIDAGSARVAKETSPESPRSRRPGPDVAARPPSDLESVMDRLLQLKSQRRFGEAATLLRQALAGGGLGPVQRERLSYELGLALEASGQKACAHWKSHVASFGITRHSDALSRRLSDCEVRGN